MEQIENEIKCSLSTAEELALLAGELGEPDRREKQHNRYIDTPELHLHKSGVILRLRSINGAGEVLFTAKAAEKLELGFISARESECRISRRKAALLHHCPAEELPGLGSALVDEVLSSIDPESLAVVAELYNDRRLYRTEAGELALDRITMPHCEEFEVELEVRDRSEGLRFLKQLFSTLGLPLTFQADPKTTRLFRSLDLL